MATATLLGCVGEFQGVAGSALSSGQIVKQGSVITVVQGLNAIASGQAAAYVDRGRFTFPMLSTDTGSVGAVVYWDDGNSRLTTTSTSNTKCGYLVTAKTSGQTTADIMLLPLGL